MIEKKIGSFWLIAGYSFSTFSLGMNLSRWGIDLNLYPLYLSVEFPMPRKTRERILSTINRLVDPNELD